MNEPKASRSSDAPRLGRLAEHVDQLGRFSRKLRDQPRTRERPRQLAEQPRPPFAAAKLGRAVIAMPRGCPPQRLQRRSSLGGVLAQIEPHGRETEDLDGAAHGPHQIGGDRWTVCLLERALDDAEIEDQLVGIGIRRTRTADVHALDAGDGGIELAQNDAQVLAVRLAGIAGFDPLSFPASRQRMLELGAEAGRNGKRTLGDGERLGQVHDPLPVMPQRGERVLPQGPGGDFGRHPRIAVAVAADPGAVLQEGRQLEMRARIMLLERGYRPGRASPAPSRTGSRRRSASPAATSCCTVGFSRCSSPVIQTSSIWSRRSSISAVRSRSVQRGSSSSRSSR